MDVELPGTWRLKNRGTGRSGSRKDGVRGAVLLAAACLATCGCNEEARTRDVVLVVVDTLRADHLGIYGYPRSTSPRLDSLAAEGVHFENAVSTSNWTVPATASLLTGLEPARSGAGLVGSNVNLDRMVPDQPKKGLSNLARKVGSQGFETALLSANPFITGTFTEGFQLARVDRVPANRLTDSAIEWLKARRGKSRFLYLHYIDVHQPNEPPTPYWEMFGLNVGEARPSEARDWRFEDQVDLEAKEFETFKRHRNGAYDGAIRFVDEQVGRLVDYLAEEGSWGKALFIVTSDHGEEFWEHAGIEREWADDPRGIWGVGHGHTFFDEVVSIPLIVRGPGIPSGVAGRCGVSLLDVGPTITSAVGLPSDPAWPGSPLQSLVSGDCPRRILVASSTAYGPPGGAIWWGKWKLVRRGDRSFLLEPGSDRAEERDLSSAEPRLAGVLARALSQRMRPESERGEPMPYDNEDLRRELRALGYL